MSNDAYFQKKWEECQANMCTGCEFCNNCKHGTEFNTCETCHPPVEYKCKHGNGEDCETCEEIQQAKEDAELEVYCKHDIEYSECHECSAEAMAQWERSQEQAEWNHFHPVGDTE